MALTPDSTFLVFENRAGEVSELTYAEFDGAGRGLRPRPQRARRRGRRPRRRPPAQQPRVPGLLVRDRPPRGDDGALEHRQHGGRARTRGRLHRGQPRDHRARLLRRRPARDRGGRDRHDDDRRPRQAGRLLRLRRPAEPLRRAGPAAAGRRRRRRRAALHLGHDLEAEGGDARPTPTACAPASTPSTASGSTRASGC